ncbi:MAG: hypothetical protein GX851_00595 [Clostridiales bacterium]|nr:hypothetical protein [Clostridiales bacterium]
MEKKLKYILCSAAGLLIVVYLCYQAYMSTYDPIKTQVALETTVYDAIDTEVFIIRDEQYIIKDASGTLVPLVEDGKRVANGDTVAVVFSNETAASSYTRIRELEDEIKHYTELSSQANLQTMDISTLNSLIRTRWINLLDTVDGGELSAVRNASNEFRDGVTNLQIATGEVLEFGDKIAALNAELTQLKAASPDYGSVKAGTSGYYISKVDGYENTVQYSSVDALDIESIQPLMSAEAAGVASNVMGKLVGNFNWYIVCTVESKRISELKIGKTITVDFPVSGIENLPVTVYKIGNNKDGYSSLILSCNMMNEELAVLRNEKARIVVNEYMGYKIPSSCIRMSDGEKGVYVMMGNVVKFRKINILYSTEEYCIVYNPDGANGYVKLYDEVVTEGTDLYDGKVIGRY